MSTVALTSTFPWEINWGKKKTLGRHSVSIFCFFFFFLLSLSQNPDPSFFWSSSKQVLCSSCTESDWKPIRCSPSWSHYDYAVLLLKAGCILHTGNSEGEKLIAIPSALKLFFFQKQTQDNYEQTAPTIWIIDRLSNENFHTLPTIWFTTYSSLRVIL